MNKTKQQQKITLLQFGDGTRSLSSSYTSFRVGVRPGIISSTSRDQSLVVLSGTQGSEIKRLSVACRKVVDRYS